MTHKNSKMIAEQIALAANRLQLQRTGHAPQSVTVVLSKDTLVVTLHKALSPAEIALARSTHGAAQVQEFHRQLFASSKNDIVREIEKITGQKVREAAAEIEAATGTVIHAFTTSAKVQVFFLFPLQPADTDQANLAVDPIEVAEDDGMRVAPTSEIPITSSPTGALNCA